MGTSLAATGWRGRARRDQEASGASARLSRVRAAAILSGVAVQYAGVIQLVECQLPKLDVAGSSPVARSCKIVGKHRVVGARTLTGPGAFFLGPVRGTRWCLEVRRQSRALLGCEHGENRLEIQPGRALTPLGLLACFAVAAAFVGAIVALGYVLR